MKTLLLLILCNLSTLLMANGAPFPPVPTEIVYLTYHDYQGCKLVEVEADGIVISHRLGVAKLLFINLPMDWRQRYGYNAEAARAAMAEQAAKNAAADAEVARVRQQEVCTQQDLPQKENALRRAEAPTESIAVQNQIAYLQSDIAFMQEQEEKITESGRYLRQDGRLVSHGAYADKIADEQAQLDQLQKQLASR